jgi:HAMP domain-containing protein
LPPAPTDSLDTQQLLQFLKALRDGDFTRHMPDGQAGAAGEIAATLNRLVDQLNQFACEVTRLSRELGTEGRYGGQAEVDGAAGTWRDLVDNVNLMAANLTNQVRNCADVTGRLAAGDLSREVTVGCAGETRGLKDNINRLAAGMRR